MRIKLGHEPGQKHLHKPPLRHSSVLESQVIDYSYLTPVIVNEEVVAGGKLPDTEQRFFSQRNSLASQVKLNRDKSQKESLELLIQKQQRKEQNSSSLFDQTPKFSSCKSSSKMNTQRL